MNKTLRQKLFHAVLLVALTAFALWFALKDDYHEVFYHLKRLPIPWLLFILAIGILYYVLQGLSLYLIGRTFKKDLRVIDGIDNAYIAAFFNGVTPLGGGQVAQTYAFRKLHMKYSDIATTLWMDFFIFQCVSLLFAGFFIIIKIPFALEHLPKFLPLIILGYLINSSVIAGLWTMIRFPNFYKKLSELVLRLLHRVHIIKNPEEKAARWNEQVMHFQKEVTKLKHHKPLIIKCSLLYVGRQTIFYLLPFVIAGALGVPVFIDDLISIMAISAFVHMLNALTPLPGDSGWTETIFIMLFGFMFGKSIAASVMILWRVSTYHLNILIGGIRFMRIKSLKPVKDEKALATADAKLDQVNQKI